jgi:anti-sigma factor ChrR (cupin superfamily)
MALQSPTDENTRTLPQPLVIHRLLQRAPLLRDEQDWSPFRPGIQIRKLYQENDGGPAAALLRYEPSAVVPLHEHLGYEHILVLDGAQTDEHGTYPAGTFIVNRPHSVHRVASEGGCVVLMIWEKGVRFPEPTPRPGETQ